MRLNPATVGTLFRAEMRMVLRDRRVLLTAILLPVLLMPLMFLGSNWTIKKRERKINESICRYAVSGPQADRVRGLLAATRARLESAAGTKTNGGFGFTEVPCADPPAALAKGDLELILEGLNGEPAAETNVVATPGRTNAVPGGHRARRRPTNDDDEAPVPGAAIVRIIFRADRDVSSAALSRMEDALHDTRREQRMGLLKRRGFPLPPARVALVHEADLASKGHVAGLALGRVITLALLFFIITSGAVVATDSLAGEKERGTLETLLTTSARRIEIITAKHLVILAIALLITLIQTANLLVYVGLKLIPLPANFTAAVPPFVVLVLFVLYLPVLALVASALLLTSGYAKSYKEAQMYFFPVFVLGLAPALTPLVPDLSLRSAIILVPVANVALAAKEILIGAFDWPMIALAWLVTAAAAVWTTRLSLRALSAEKLITASDTDAIDFAGGPALFSRRVPLLFALLWAALLIVNNYLEKADLRLQVFVNLVVLFFGASCLMLRFYHLDPRAALALRAPKPAVWLAVLLGVPGGLLTASGLFRLANVFIPVSAKMMQEFDQAVIPAGMSLAQLLFFIAVLPGIFEEITFRGLLLHGLSRRLHPATLALVVGVVFGLFHVALFRLAPTAALGILLAAVTLLTGSIFPAMLWHALSNATSLLAYHLKLPLEELDPLCYLLGAGFLAVSFWIIWRNRTPYPGLRPWSARRSPLVGTSSTTG